ncbi:MAG: ABC transporter permease [Oenococcus sp.]|uniref:ABC transporter permease n=1 Tax=Oenococcus sp. TaxID=1979414 RepID=UPI0039E88DEA
MKKYLLKRILSIIPVFIVVGILAFMLVHLIPGNPAKVMLGSEGTPSQVANLEKSMGLDRPLIIQFFVWSGRILTGNFGKSVYSGDSVIGDIASHLGVTISLSVFAMIIAIALSIPISIYAVNHKKSFINPLVSGVSMLGVSIPSFWLSLMAILLFCVTWRIFPVSGYVSIFDDPFQWLRHIFLPAAILGVLQMGIITRMLKNSMLEHYSDNFILMARSTGESNKEMIRSHLFKNALIPTITVIGNSFASLLGGAVVVETIFALPGVGQLFVTSITNRDYPMIQGIIIIMASIYVLVNLVVDFSYSFLDPRIELQ